MADNDAIKILSEYVRLGFAIIPIKSGEKKALVKWECYQEKPATLEQVLEWYELFPNCNWAVITGNVSDVIVVDCDNPTALQVAEEYEITSGASVKTPHGYHYYFLHPHDNKLRKTISGHVSKGTYWPQVKGLDLRYEGGYALIPPSKGYEWEIELEDLSDELIKYPDWAGATYEDEVQPELIQQKNPATVINKFSDLDLTNTAIEGAGKNSNETEKKFKEIAEQYPDGKIARGGSGIHDATYHFLAEELLLVGIGPELEAAGHRFMETYFSEPLKDGRFETSLKTVRDKERTNHPERFDANNNYTYHLKTKGVTPIPPIQATPIQAKPKRNILRSDDAAEFAEGKDIACWQSPWLPKASIIQVHGYSGHGKSLFLQHALHHAATGLHFGPFNHEDKPNVLYLDFENGRTTWGRRVEQMKSSFGNPKDNLGYWTPWLNDEYINLREPEGVNKLLEFLNEYNPDVLVIDTVRSAFAGIKENSSEEWSSLNQLAINIRNAGCTVILVHHSNKPDKDGAMGREAGSTNQLTALETQIKVTQVMEDADAAKAKAAIFAGDLSTNPFHYMRQQMPIDSVLQMVMEVAFGKCREWTDLHDLKQYVGIAVRPDGRSYICHSDGPKERLKKLIDKRTPRDLILGKMGRPLQTLEQWAKEMKLGLPKN